MPKTDSYPFLILEFVPCTNFSLFRYKIANEHREFRNYLLTIHLKMLQCLHMLYHYFRPQHPANPHKHLLFTLFVILPCLINATV